MDVNKILGKEEIKESEELIKETKEDCLTWLESSIPIIYEMLKNSIEKDYPYEPIELLGNQGVSLYLREREILRRNKRIGFSNKVKKVLSKLDTELENILKELETKTSDTYDIVVLDDIILFSYGTNVIGLLRERDLVEALIFNSEDFTVPTPQNNEIVPEESNSIAEVIGETEVEELDEEDLDLQILKELQDGL